MGRLSRKSLGLLMLLAVLVIASCSSGDDTPKQSGIEITDQLRRVVRLNKVPQRIVSLAPQNTEILFALGLGDKVVGVTTYCNFPPEAQEKPQIGGFSTVDVEKVVSQSPDLVLAAHIHEKETLPQLESYGLKVLVLDPKTLSEATQAIELVGKATGTEQEAHQVVEDMNARMATVARLVADLSAEERPRVFYLLWHDPLRTAGHDTVQSQLIDLAGGKSIFSDLNSYPTVGLEALLERQPQVIIVGTGHGSAQDKPLEWAQTEPRLKNTEALIQEKVFAIDADLTSRLGPRVVDALEEILLLIHPELAARLEASG